MTYVEPNEIIEHLGNLRKTRAFQIECNLIRNSSGIEMFDIALFVIDGHKRAAHISLFPDQCEQLRDILNRLDIGYASGQKERR